MRIIHWLAGIAVLGWVLVNLWLSKQDSESWSLDEYLDLIPGTQELWKSKDYPAWAGINNVDEIQFILVSNEANAAKYRGYAGPIELLIAIDKNGYILNTRIMKNAETPSYLAELQSFLSQFASKHIGDPLEIDNDIDAMTGATITSAAIAKNISISGKEASNLILKSNYPIPTELKKAKLSILWSLIFFTALGLTIYGYITQRNNSYKPMQPLTRGAAQTLVMFAAWGYGIFLSIITIINLTKGIIPSYNTMPEWVIYLYGIGLLLILNPGLFCGSICPFGALQELLGLLGQKLHFSIIPNMNIHIKARVLKYWILILIPIVAILSNNLRLLNFEPFKITFSGGSWLSYTGILVIIILTASALVTRFFCKYFCPLGAFISLLVKLRIHGNRCDRVNCPMQVTNDYENCIACRGQKGIAAK